MARRNKCIVSCFLFCLFSCFEQDGIALLSVVVMALLMLHLKASFICRLEL